MKPIQYISFEGKGSGFKTAGLDRRRMDRSNALAKDWINTNPQVEVISITQTLGEMLAVVTVWYR